MGEGKNFMSKNKKPNGFTAVAVAIAVFMVALVTLVGWHVIADNNKTKTVSSSSQQVMSNPDPQPPAKDPYTGWKTYEDIGYPLASGISIKYPADWQILVGNNKAFAWIIKNNRGSQNIDARVNYLNSDITPEQEWDNCPSADSCGPTPGDTKLEGKNSVVNDIYTYSVKMQNSSGAYYSTVLKSNNSSNDGKTAYVELLSYNDDPTVMNIYKQIISSAVFRD
jgi:hypothetical protein